MNEQRKNDVLAAIEQVVAEIEAGGNEVSPDDVAEAANWMIQPPATEDERHEIVALCEEWT